MKLFISSVVLSLFLAPALAQNTLANWNGDFIWDAPTGPTPACYNFYKSLVSGGPYTKVNAECITDLTFNDPTAVEGEFFAVSSVNSIGLEGLSAEIELTDPDSPTQLRTIQIDVSVTVTVSP